MFLSQKEFEELVGHRFIIQLLGMSCMVQCKTCHLCFTLGRKELYPGRQIEGRWLGYKDFVRPPCPFCSTNPNLNKDLFGSGEGI